MRGGIDRVQHRRTVGALDIDPVAQSGHDRQPFPDPLVPFGTCAVLGSLVRDIAGADWAAHRPRPPAGRVVVSPLGESSYFPDWLLERRRRTERALTTVVATCYLLGVSPRRTEKLVETLGIIRLSKSQVSVMAKELDEHVADFRSRLADAGPNSS